MPPIGSTTVEVRLDNELHKVRDFVIYGHPLHDFAHSVLILAALFGIPVAN